MASKDNELIKTHSVIDKLNQEVLTVTCKESELKTAVERIRVSEEEDIEPPYELVKEIETLKLQVQQFTQKSQTTEITLASKDVELTIAYEVIDSFKQDILTLTDQLETIKNLQLQRN